MNKNAENKMSDGLRDYGPNPLIVNIRKDSVKTPLSPNVMKLKKPKLLWMPVEQLLVIQMYVVRSTVEFLAKTMKSVNSFKLALPLLQ